MQSLVRLTEIEIHNIKNVRNGRIECSRNKRGNILGIYGQNGSGKTVVVDCMLLLKFLLSGKQIPSRFYHYINSSSQTARVQYCFEIQSDSRAFFARYEVELSRTKEPFFCISNEKLSVKECVEGSRLTPIFDYCRDKGELFRPRKYAAFFEKNIESIVALGIAKQGTQDIDEEKQLPKISSFLFSQKAQSIFARAEGNEKQIFFFSNILQNYGLYDLMVIEHAYYGFLTLNQADIPVIINWLDHVKPSGAALMLHINDINIVPREIYPYVKNTIKQINLVMKTLIPEIKIELYNAFDKLMKSGKDGVQFEIVTMRGETRIPLLYESSGVKKLISICGSLVACYNRESYCLVVDELDAGIYEYLLGECLDVMQNNAKGQLIFTSHNLRPLEVLDREALIYTTVNPNNRYIKSSYIKNTQNTRLSYLRTIKLGGQKEKLYDETNVYEIELAMRRAGKVGLYD